MNSYYSNELGVTPTDLVFGFCVGWIAYANGLNFLKNVPLVSRHLLKIEIVKVFDINIGIARHFYILMEKM